MISRGLDCIPRKLGLLDNFPPNYMHFNQWHSGASHYSHFKWWLRICVRWQSLAHLQRRPWFSTRPLSVAINRASGYENRIENGHKNGTGTSAIGSMQWQLYNRNAFPFLCARISHCSAADTRIITVFGAFCPRLVCIQGNIQTNMLRWSNFCISPYNLCC